MKLLLDTCTFLWIIWDAPELSPRARALYQSPDHDVSLSIVSAWEIAVKHGLGRLPLPVAPEELIPRQRQRHGIDLLPLDEGAALRAHRLPPLHRDPFDRMLVSQAITSGAIIVTPDERISSYAVPTVW